MMDSHADENDKNHQKLRAAVLQRDDFTCAFCAFRALRFQHFHHLDDDHNHEHESNLVTACPFCHLCFHLGMAGIRRAAVMIWLPEIGQAELNNLCRAIFVAVERGGAYEQAARALYASLESRSATVEQELGAGASNPAAIGQALLKMPPATGEDQGSKVTMLRLLPRMQSFKAEVSFWSTDASAFGRLPDARWGALVPQLAGLPVSDAAAPPNSVDEDGDEEDQRSRNPRVADPLLHRMAGRASSDDGRAF